MTQFLANKQVLLGVTGSIAAYKSADLVRRLREAGAVVRVAMTENAKRFITPLTMQAVSGNPVHDDLFDLAAEAAMGHIELARWADLILVAPATADFMARVTEGRADDLLTAVCLATRARVAVVPAMNQRMWHHTLTQQNLQALRQKNMLVLGPASGSQACGDVGMGRMLEPADIVEQVSALFATGALAGRSVIVTAGPTHEAIDPVRYIANYSSGKMGFALAQAAHEAGAHVTLITGPVHLPFPLHMKTIAVTSAAEMHEAVMNHIIGSDIFIAVAAVADYRAQSIAQQKLHKTQEHIMLQLERNPDIISTVASLPNKPFVIGFAAETENVIEQARAKRLRKNMDMIIANQVGAGRGMGADDNEVTVITAETETALPLMPKQKLARELIELIARKHNAVIPRVGAGSKVGTCA
jgi:phosphopantothenoylcysteine decarboxylase/phosphopantothenate--cysteine ligase